MFHARDEDSPPIKVYPPFAFMIALVAALVLDHTVPIRLLPPFPWGPGIFVGLGLAAAALVLGFSGIGAFKKAKTPAIPYYTPRALVTGGIYRITRNPMYLGLVTLLLSLFPLFSSTWSLIAAIALWIALDRLVVLPEERYLSAKFGDAYDEFLARTRRWL